MGKERRLPAEVFLQTAENSGQETQEGRTLQEDWPSGPRPRRKSKEVVTGALAQTQAGRAGDSFIQGQPRAETAELAGPAQARIRLGEDLLGLPPLGLGGQAGRELVRRILTWGGA